MSKKKKGTVKEVLELITAVLNLLALLVQLLIWAIKER